MVSRVAVIDYGMGNLHSVAKALEHVSEGNHEVLVTSDPALIRSAERVVLPGVGAMRDCMGEIKRLGIDALVRESVRDKPLLGVCVGMQALMQHSEENNGVDCIGLFPGSVRHFGKDLDLKVPHMGWNTVRQVNSAHPMWNNINDNSYFYFVHSYCVEHNESTRPFVAGVCNYGFDFAAAITQKNVFATQFHPEKSHNDGLQLYKNFLSWNGLC